MKLAKLLATCCKKFDTMFFETQCRLD